MRRSFWSRVLAGWLACWLPLVVADGGWLHACPMHDGAPAATMTAAMSPAAMPMDMAPAAAHAHAASPACSHRHGSDSRHAGGHTCTCLGACCGVVAVMPPAPPAVTFDAAAPRAVRPTGRPTHEYVAAWVDFVLPFATAPPVQG